MTETETDLIPVRALNQVTYCQRLYYLEYVECVMPINEHVEDGLFQHRRVDDPALQHRRRKEGDALHTRSVQLSSERLGITGKLDLVEEKNGAVYPVEYKRGSGPGESHGQPPFWDNDAVQVCAQGLLLEEELGVPVPHGILYYIGSKTRVDGPVRRRPARQDAGGDRGHSRALAPATRRRSRCPRSCGTAVSAARWPRSASPRKRSTASAASDLSPAEETAAGLTRVLPQSDDGAVLYLQEPGSHVGKRSEHLVVKKDGAGDPARAASPRSGRCASSATCRFPRRPWNAWPRSTCRSST